MRRTEGDARDHMGEPLDLGAVGSDVDTTNDGAAIAYCLDTGDTRIEDECVRDRSLDVTVHDVCDLVRAAAFGRSLHDAKYF